MRRPKIADYPFTTLASRDLGRACASGPRQSFVVADIPASIEGAARGCRHRADRFLRHLQRTRLLLHVVDMAPFDHQVDPVAQAEAIVEELRKYDEGPKRPAAPSAGLKTTTCGRWTRTRQAMSCWPRTIRSSRRRCPTHSISPMDKPRWPRSTSWT